MESLDLLRNSHVRGHLILRGPRGHSCDRGGQASAPWMRVISAVRISSKLWAGYSHK